MGRIRDFFMGRSPTPEAQAETIMSGGDPVLRAILEGNTLTRRQAMTIPEVAADVDLISSTFATLPVRLYRKNKKDGVVQIEEVNDARAQLLNDDTGDTLDGFQLKKAMCEDYLMDGGGYAFLNKIGNKVKSIHYVPSESVFVEHNTDKIFKKYRIRVDANAYEPFQFLKMLRSSRNGWGGTGIIDEVSDALNTAYKTIIFQLNMVEKGGNKKGFLTTENRLGDKEIELLRRAWANLYSNNTDNVVVLNKGMKFQESSNNAVEMQLNSSKITLDKEIDKLFHMDDNTEKFVKMAILPIGTAFKTALNRDLLLESEKGSYFFDIDYTETLKSSMKERYEAYQIGKNAGFIGINEIRKRENLPEVDGLDVIDLGLGSTLFNMKTGETYVPNTGSVHKDGENSEDSSPAPDGKEPDEPQEGVNDDEN